MEITEEKLQAVKDKLDESIDGVDTLDTLDAGIGQINDTARGWGEHARLADNFPVIAEELDDYLIDRIVQRVCHVKRMKRKRCQDVHLRSGRKGFYLVDCYRLVCLSDLGVIREVKPPKPYRPK